MERLLKKGRALFAGNNLLAGRYLVADARWVGAFRIAFGLLLCIDVIRRFQQAREFFSNDGFLPNHFSLFRPMGDGVFSLLHAFSTLGEVRAVMLLMLGVFVCYTLGYKTRVAQVLALISITSLDARNIFIENGGNVVVNVAALLTLPLPLGQRLSVDAVLANLKAERETSPAELNRRALPAANEPVVSLAVFGIFLQLAVIYFFNAVHKNGRGWLDGSAIHWFLHQDRIVTTLGIWIRENVPYEVIRGFTYGTLSIEYALAGLLLFPFFRTWVVRIALLLAIGLHGGIALTSRLGPFSYIMVLLFLPLLGAADWGVVKRWFARDARRRTVVFDVDCGFCLLVCRVLKRLDLFERLTFVGNDQLGELPVGVDPAIAKRSVLVVDAKSRVHAEERAIFEIARALPFGVCAGFWLMIPGLRWLSRGAYRCISKNRQQISVFLGLGACGVARAPVAAPSAPPPPGESFRSFRSGVFLLGREVLAGLIIAVLGFQVANDNAFINRRFKVQRPEWSTDVANTFRLLEGWGMFAPEPPYEDGRLVVDGRARDGRKLDPFTGEEPDFDPFTRVGWMHEQFTCDYQNKIRSEWHVPDRHHLGEYLKNWHKYHGEPKDELVAFDVWWVQDRSPPPGQQKGEPLPPQKLLSHGHIADSGARGWLKLQRRNRTQGPTP